MHRVEVVLRDILQIEHVDLLVRVAGHHERELPAHLMNRLAEVRLTNLIQLVALNLPELYHGVPAGANQIALSIQCK